MVLHTLQKGEIMSKDTGGQAFPSTTEQYHGDGMTLRDYFAGQALIGQISTESGVFNLGESYKKTSKMCYIYADAMISERNKE